MKIPKKDNIPRMESIMSQINLSSTIRNNLIELTKQRQQEDKSSRKLESGKLASQASDNAVIFFRSRSLDQKAQDYLSRRDELKKGVNIAKSALEGLSALDNFVKQIQGIAIAAKSNSTSEKIQSTQDFNSILKQISAITTDTSFDSVNLLSSSVNYDITFTDSPSSSISLQAKNYTGDFQNLTFSKFGIGAGFSAISDQDIANGKLDLLINKFDTAKQSFQAHASQLGVQAAVLETRLSFTEKYVNRLKEGSDNLQSADLNLEAVNVLNVKTRTQLIFNSLSKFKDQQNQYLNSITARRR